MSMCIKGSEGRVLRGRHEASCGSPEECPGCLPCPEPHCRLCRVEHADGTCPACLFTVRQNLHAVVRYAQRLPEEALEGRGASGRGGIPGGDALVLSAPAATSHGYAGQLLHRLLFGLDTSHTLEEARTDPTPPLQVLLHWEDRWRAASSQPTDLAPTLERSAAYLERHLHEAARDLSFIPFARAMAGLVRQLEDVLLDGERAERSRVPCLECGVRLVKLYGATLEEDQHECPRCGERYDQARFTQAKHHHLASAGADRFVHIPDAAAAVGRPEQTVRAWIRRGMVSTSRDPETLRLTAWWPHIRAAHQEATARKRKRSTDA